MKLYHGSNIAIERIDLARGLRGKDFGQEFYLSDSVGQVHSIDQAADVLYTSHTYA